MRKVWIDTDIGSDIDDAVALLCAARHPEIEVVGVSTVYGRVEARQWLAQELLSRAGLDLLVLAGAITPLGGQAPPEELPSYETLAPVHLTRLSAEHDELRANSIATAMRVAEEFDLITIGPLTNIGRMLASDPGIASCWRSVTCMAGRLEGDPERNAPEYNIWCDPVGAKLVFQRTNPKLVGLEACSDILTRPEVEALLNLADPASAFLLDCYREYRNRGGTVREEAPLTLFDAITLLSLVAPEAFLFDELRVAMDASGRLRLTDDGVPVSYARSSEWGKIKPVLESLLRRRSY